MHNGLGIVVKCPFKTGTDEERECGYLKCGGYDREAGWCGLVSGAVELRKGLEELNNHLADMVDLYKRALGGGNQGEKG